jgi:hypothetical protein
MASAALTSLSTSSRVMRRTCTCAAPRVDQSINTGGEMPHLTECGLRTVSCAVRHVVRNTPHLTITRRGSDETIACVCMCVCMARYSRELASHANQLRIADANLSRHIDLFAANNPLKCTQSHSHSLRPQSTVDGKRQPTGRWRWHRLRPYSATRACTGPAARSGPDSSVYYPIREYPKCQRHRRDPARTTILSSFKKR